MEEALDEAITFFPNRELILTQLPLPSTWSAASFKLPFPQPGWLGEASCPKTRYQSPSSRDANRENYISPAVLFCLNGSIRYLILRGRCKRRRCSCRTIPPCLSLLYDIRKRIFTVLYHRPKKIYHKPCISTSRNMQFDVKRFLDFITFFYSHLLHSIVCSDARYLYR